MKISCVFSLLIASALALTACGGGDGFSPECADLCALAPTASPTEGECTSDLAESLGYNTDHPDCVVLAAAFVTGSATVAQCTACYRSMNVSGRDCAAAESTCVAGGPGPDAGSGTPDANQSTPDAPTGTVSTCAQACELAPIATPVQGACTTTEVENLGYNTDNLPCSLLAASFVSGTATQQECIACYAAIAITDADCSTVYGMCF